MSKKEAPVPESEKTKMKYGVPELAEMVGLTAASVRVGLRAMEVDKAENSRYGWNTKAEMEKLAKAFKERAARAPEMLQKSKKKGEATEEKPKTPRRKSTKKAAAEATA